MPTINQLLKNIRKKKIKQNRKRALQKNPQKKGVCIKPLKLNPKKPNSAVRKVARLFLTNNFKVTAYIPGMGGHTLQKFSVVLIRGGRVRDLPGIKYKIIRGKFDLKGVLHRTKARSKYGIKKFD